MSFSAIAGVFLKLPRLFLRICRWVLARMALQCKASGLNGGFPMSSTAKERPRGTNSRKWKTILLVCAVICVVGAIWVFFYRKDSSFSRKDKIIDAWREKAQVLRRQFNVSKDEVDALATLFSKSDQACVLGLYNFIISSPQFFFILHRPTQFLLALSISRKPIKNSAY